jgi:UDP-N-acetylglucosamine transferase subunit ALG13
MTTAASSDAKASSGSGLRCLVTVGTTKFDDLYAALDSRATDAVTALQRLGISHMILQHGASPVPNQFVAAAKAKGLACECFSLKPNISKDMSEADLVICHAGMNKARLCSHAYPSFTSLSTVFG